MTRSEGEEDDDDDEATRCTPPRLAPEVNADADVFNRAPAPAVIVVLVDVVEDAQLGLQCPHSPCAFRSFRGWRAPQRQRHADAGGSHILV